jgi:hypothetical protein
VKRLGLTAIVFAILTGTTACDINAPIDWKEIALPYRGHDDLHCVSNNPGGTGNGSALVCDFDRFYGDHPDLSPSPAKASR